MLGWKELSNKTEKFYNSLPIQKQIDCIILCRSYGQAGALKYYSNDKAFSQKVICANGSFILWIPSTIDFKDIILVEENKNIDNGELFIHFNSKTIIDSVTNTLSRQYGDKIIYFQQADSIAVKMAKEKLNTIRSQFSRSSSLFFH